MQWARGDGTTPGSRFLSWHLKQGQIFSLRQGQFGGQSAHHPGPGRGKACCGHPGDSSPDLPRARGDGTTPGLGRPPWGLGPQVFRWPGRACARMPPGLWSVVPCAECSVCGKAGLGGSPPHPSPVGGLWTQRPPRGGPIPESSAGLEDGTSRLGAAIPGTGTPGFPRSGAQARRRLAPAAAERPFWGLAPQTFRGPGCRLHPDYSSARLRCSREKFSRSACAPEIRNLPL